MPSLRKRPWKQSPDGGMPKRPEINIASSSTVALSSEDPAHPIEAMLDGQFGRGASRWRAAQADTTEQIEFDFDKPQTLSRVQYEVEETERERGQEIRIEASCDKGRTYRQIVMQQYNFSPTGATYQREDISCALSGVTNLRITIVPNRQGTGTATLTSLRLFG